MVGANRGESIVGWDWVLQIAIYRDGGDVIVGGGRNRKLLRGSVIKRQR
ncbi:MAG: hypothetical protein NTY10_00725 [Candidatus Omnitrophica bacterium]|nr:hypothetical protein [Candidatus Omnitrophota bacterium]